jgi:hypothetical protein
MLVPKASIHLHNHPVAPQYDIGFSGKLSLMQPKTETHRMNDFAYDQLRLGMRLTYASHDSGARQGNWSVIAQILALPAISLLGTKIFRAATTRRLALSVRVCHKRFGNHNCGSLRTTNKAAAPWSRTKSHRLLSMSLQAAVGLALD